MLKTKNILQLFSILLLLNRISYAQIENNSFENWEVFLNSVEIPSDWATLNFQSPAVTKSTDAHDGSFAAKLEFTEYFGKRFEPILETGGFGDRINSRPKNINFYIKSDFKNFARLTVIISTIDSLENTGTLNFNGSADTLIRANSPSWQAVTLPIHYFDEEIPKYILIAFALQDSAADDNLNGIGSYVIIDEISIDAPTTVSTLNGFPKEFSLSQNYPNPFNPTTIIQYSIPVAALSSVEAQEITLKIYDVLGREVKTLVNKKQSPGKYEIKFDASDLSSGVYFYTLQAGNFLQTNKMILSK